MSVAKNESIKPSGARNAKGVYIHSHAVYTHHHMGRAGIKKSLLCGTNLGEENIYILNNRKSCLDPPPQNKSVSVGRAANSVYINR